MLCFEQAPEKERKLRLIFSFQSVATLSVVVVGREVIKRHQNPGLFIIPTSAK